MGQTLRAAQQQEEAGPLRLLRRSPEEAPPEETIWRVCATDDCSLRRSLTRRHASQKCALSLPLGLLWASFVQFVSLFSGCSLAAAGSKSRGGAHIESNQLSHQQIGPPHTRAWPPKLPPADWLQVTGATGPQLTPTSSSKCGQIRSNLAKFALTCAQRKWRPICPKPTRQEPPVDTEDACVGAPCLGRLWACWPNCGRMGCPNGADCP